MKKKLLSNRKVLSIVIALLVVGGLFAFFMFNPSNESDVSSWFKTNYFPSNDFATASLLDGDITSLSQEDYQGSTEPAWFLSIMATTIVLLGFFIYFAKERKLL